MFIALRALGRPVRTGRSVRKRKSSFPPVIVETAKGGGLDIQLAPGVTAQSWPAEEMRSFLASRHWGPWILENEPICRRLVAVFATAIERDQVCLMTEEQLMKDPADEDIASLRTAKEVLPWLGDVKRGKGSFWIAPHVVNQLVGLLLQHNHLPRGSTALVNHEIDPARVTRRVRDMLVVGAFALAMWLVLIVDVIGNLEFRYRLAIRPRTADGVVGIFCTWACHLDFEHLIGNTFGFLSFSFVIVANFGLAHWAGVFLTSCLSVGLLWLASDGGMCGASGVVFGLFGFCLLICPPRCRSCCLQWCSPGRWMFSRSACRDLAVAAGLWAIYSCLIFGIFPSGEKHNGVRVSWESHLLGFVGGIVAAGYVANRMRADMIANRRRLKRRQAWRARIGAAPSAAASSSTHGTHGSLQLGAVAVSIASNGGGIQPPAAGGRGGGADADAPGGNPFFFPSSAAGGGHQALSA